MGGEQEAVARHGRAAGSSRRGIHDEEMSRYLRFAIGLFHATGGAMALEVRSAAFAEGGSIPPQYTCDGKNVSPPLSWSGVPAAAKSLALVCDDPDAPAGVWVHWVLYELPPSVAALPEGVAARIRQSCRAPAHRGPRSRGARRQPDRTDLHRRRVRELSLSRAPFGRSLEPGRVGAAGRRARSVRRSPDGGGQVRPSPQPTASRRVRELPGIPVARDRAAAGLPHVGRSRPARVRVLPRGARRGGRPSSPGGAPVRPWRAVPDRRRRPPRLLRSEPAEHVPGTPH